MEREPIAPVFVDWITLVERHPQGGLPIICRGLHSWSDSQGVCLSERIVASHLGGSSGTTVLVGCDGFSTYLSGNVGRFNRADNLFNLAWEPTLAKCNRMVAALGLPPFGTTPGLSDARAWAESAFVGPGPAAKRSRGARVLRVDLTRNFSSGSDAQARALVRWAQGLEHARHRPGKAGHWGAWWANTSRMIKIYLKGQELLDHVRPSDSDASKRHVAEIANWCLDHGLVRLEVELKRRELQRLSLSELGDVTDERLGLAFEDETAFLRKVDRSDEPDILMSIPSRSRVHAAAWMKGQDLRQLLSNGTFYRHARVLRQYGIDITQRRDIANFPVKVRVVNLSPLSPPSWYEWDEKAA